MLAGGAVERIETEYAASDGSVLTVSLVISPINASSGALVGVATIVRDRTAQSLAALNHGVVLQDALDVSSP
jgi:hypothetical protein